MSTSAERRAWLIALASSLAALSVRVQAQELLGEDDIKAVIVGYVSDAKRANVKKYPQFAAHQKCASCILYEGKGNDESGPCPLFVRKHVAAAGWCSVWLTKKG